MTTRLTALLLGASLIAPFVAPFEAQAQQVSFGDDSGAWANDGECDDPRFEGEGMAQVTIPGDEGRDASDCRAAYQAGTIALIGGAQGGGQGGPPAGGGQGAGGQVGGQLGGQAGGGIDYGDDASQWANDGECDDPRFEGPGVADTAIDADAFRDASDCRAAVTAGTASLIGGGPAGGGAAGGKGGGLAAGGQGQDLVSDGIVWGDDSGDYPNDGECDDRRFGGGGMATTLGGNNIGRDASDCQALFQQGAIYPWDQADSLQAVACERIDFGADDGQFPMDGQCDDPRFEGIGMAWGLDSTETGRDASDCERACTLGTIGARDY